MKRKATAIGIAEAMADVETAVSGGDQAATADAVTVLHKRLRTGLYLHAAALGLTQADVAEIDNIGPQRRGGEPKEAADLTGEE